MEKISEELYELLFETATEGIIICNQKGLIKNVNEAAEKMFGYHEKELLDKKIEVLIPQQFKKNHDKHRESYMKSPSKRKMGAGRDLFGLTKNGQEIPIEISLNHVSLNDETFVMALITDITERKSNERIIQQLNEELKEKIDERTKKLQESEKLYSLISRNFPNGIINVFDQNLNYIFVEGQELFKLGISSEQLMGRNYLERLPIDIANEIKTQLELVFKGQENSFDIKSKHQIYHLNAVPLVYDEKGDVEQILVVERNVTNERLAEQKTKEALKKEKELGELKSRFVSMASHEFRTPLSTVLSSASLIEKYEQLGNHEKVEKHLNKIKTSVKNLTGILNDILSLSRLEEGRVEINPSYFNLKTLVEDIIEDLSGLVKENQTIKFKFTGEEMFCNDEKIIRLIIINLLSNAVKYSSKEVLIELSSDSNKGITTSIIDYGIGIPVKDQEQLFDRFFRAQNVTNIQGTGLGLNIVKNYLDVLNGSIDLKSEENKGTTVNFSIPLRN